MRFFKVVLVRGDETREIRVPSRTGIQAGDAASSFAHPGEAIQSIEEVQDDRLQADGPPPKSQAAELAPATPGVAEAPSRSEPR